MKATQVYVVISQCCDGRGAQTVTVQQGHAVLQEGRDNGMHWTQRLTICMRYM